MSPHAVAFLGLVLAWVLPVPVAFALLHSARGPARWLAYPLAVVLLACWGPLVLAAPALLRSIA